MKRLLAFAVAVGLSAPAMSAELIVNGGFETGTFAGWTTSVQSGSQGDIFIDDVGSTTPLSGMTTINNPSGGSYYAVTDQFGPGAYALTQSFTVPLGTTFLFLEYRLFVNSYADITVNPAGLDYTASPNQHVRVDILTGSADPLSTSPSDVVFELPLVTPLPTNPNIFTLYGVSGLHTLLTPGETYQIRFGEVDNQGFLNMGVDTVSLQAEGNAVPEPGTWAMMLLGFGVMGWSFKRRRKLALA